MICLQLLRMLRQLVVVWVVAGGFIPADPDFRDHVLSDDPPTAEKDERASRDGDALRKGDQVVTAGGLIGKVVKVKEDNEIDVELAQGVKVRVVQSTIQTVLSKTEPKT